MTVPIANNDHTIGQPESVWMATTPTTSYPVLDGAPMLDVIVVGAGIAGLTTAYLLQIAGMRVAIVEKDRIVAGVTGYTTAKVTSLHTLIYAELIKNFGEESAYLYGQANQTGLEKIASLSQQLAIDCDFKRTSAYTFAETDADRKHVEDEVEAALKLKLPASFVEQVPLPLTTNGAVMFSDQAQFHPRKYLLGLADAFVKSGGVIFEDTRVLKIDEHDDSTSRCTVETSRGSLDADRVVICSHYPIYDPALYFTRLAPHRSCVIATTLQEPVPDGMFISCSKDGHSFRNQPLGDQTLWFVGGEDYKTGQSDDVLELYHKLEQYARAHFRVEKVLYHWATQDNRTIDRMPYVGKISPSTSKVYVATGFDGWGMTNGTAAGLLLSDELLGKPNDAAKVFDPNRFKPMASVGTLVTEGANVAKEFISGWLPKFGKDADNPKRGEGIVTESKQGKLAVSRDQDGNLHAVSAVCTHMGCIVAWNNAEQSWDCPCHASRFAPDGKVLHGPAVTDLKQMSLDDE